MAVLVQAGLLDPECLHGLEVDALDQSYQLDPMATLFLPWYPTHLHSTPLYTDACCINKCHQHHFNQHLFCKTILMFLGLHNFIHNYSLHINELAANIPVNLWELLWQFLKGHPTTASQHSYSSQQHNQLRLIVLTTLKTNNYLLRTFKPTGKYYHLIHQLCVLDLKLCVWTCTYSILIVLQLNLYLSLYVYQY